MTVTTPLPDDLAAGGKKPGMGRVLRDQKKSILVAVVLGVAAFWIAGQLGEWRLATAIAIGVGLGLLNHLATEFWLLRIIVRGEQPTRATMVRSTLGRLLVLTASPWPSPCGGGRTASDCCSGWPSSASSPW